MIFNLQHQVQRIFQVAGVKINGSNPWDIQVHDSRFYKRLLLHRAKGLGESYMDGWWDCAAVDELFFRLQNRIEVSSRLDGLFNLCQTFYYYVFNQQSKSRSLEVAELHYNLNNELYCAMLEKSMAYTCAYWKDASDLSSAQYAKYDLICKKLMLKN